MIHQQRNKLAVKLLSGQFHQIGAYLVDIPGDLVGPAGKQGVKDVSHRYQFGIGVDVLDLQAQIAASVQALVMLHSDDRCGVENLNLPGQLVLPEGRMLPNRAEFLRSQLSRLVKDGRRDFRLADIVEQRGLTDDFRFLCRAAGKLRQQGADFSNLPAVFKISAAYQN